MLVRLRVALLTAAALWLVVASAPPVLAGTLPRTPVRETPVLFGRPAARFILETETTVSETVYGLRIPAGIFAPTIQDAEGVFYEAVNRFVISGEPVQGGLYVSKSQPGRILIYVGDARGSGCHVTFSPQPLRPDAARKFKIGKPLRNDWSATTIGLAVHTVLAERSRV